jgi:DNA-binding response OmpR family regulator
MVTAGNGTERTSGAVRPATVLIVEDEPRLADVIARNLEARGHETRRATTAAGAILKIQEAWPDVLLLDINLPDFSGWEVLRRFSHEKEKKTRVIIMSAATVSQKRVDEFRPAHVLQKPFLITTLLRAVDDGGDQEQSSLAGRNEAQ